MVADTFDCSNALEENHLVPYSITRGLADRSPMCFTHVLLCALCVVLRYARVRAKTEAPSGILGIAMLTDFVTFGYLGCPLNPFGAARQR